MAEIDGYTNPIVELIPGNPTGFVVLPKSGDNEDGMWCLVDGIPTLVGTYSQTQNAIASYLNEIYQVSQFVGGYTDGTDDAPNVENNIYPYSE